MLLWACPTPFRDQLPLIYSLQLSLPLRASQVPQLIFPRALPPPTEESGDCFCPLLHRRSQASSTWVDWPLLLYCVTRPKRVRLRCGSRVRLARLRQRCYHRPRLLGYLPNGQSTRYPPLRILDQPGFPWRFQRRKARPCRSRRVRQVTSRGPHPERMRGI